MKGSGEERRNKREDTRKAQNNDAQVLTEHAGARMARDGPKTQASRDTSLFLPWWGRRILGP